MEAVLLANTASTFFMVGLAWFVDVVHYPLFDAVGNDRFPGYHEQHSRRTTWVVLPVMSIELITSIALAIEPPGDVSRMLALVGAALAIATWALTLGAAVPAHRALGLGFTGARLDRLRRADLIRALTWTAHGAVVIAMLASLV